MGLTAAEAALCDEVSSLGAAAWTASVATEGLNTDPKMFSVMLFRRLWSNHRGFLVLWTAGLIDEAGMILRSGLEAAISIAANARLGGAFQVLMRNDGAYTLQRQIKRFLEEGDDERAAEAQAALALMRAGLPDGTKHVPLNWKELATESGLPVLYSSHRMLSGISSHVTGQSILQGVVSDDETEALQDELEAIGAQLG
jgi:hypothetical protein